MGNLGLCCDSSSNSYRQPRRRILPVRLPFFELTAGRFKQLSIDAYSEPIVAEAGIIPTALIGNLEELLCTARMFSQFAPHLHRCRKLEIIVCNDNIFQNLYRNEANFPDKASKTSKIFARFARKKTFDRQMQ